MHMRTRFLKTYRLNTYLIFIFAKKCVINDNVFIIIGPQISNLAGLQRPH